jgi:hypothetical protein
VQQKDNYSIRGLERYGKGGLQVFLKPYLFLFLSKTKGNIFTVLGGKKMQDTSFAIHPGTKKQIVGEN